MGCILVGNINIELCIVISISNRYFEYKIYIFNICKHLYNLQTKQEGRYEFLHLRHNLQQRYIIHLQ